MEEHNNGSRGSNILWVKNITYQGMKQGNNYYYQRNSWKEFKKNVNKFI